MKSRIAEWILSLVLPPDRAVSVAGDFAEEAERLGDFWFWSGIFRTAASLVWRDLSGHAGFWVSLAFRAWLVNVAGFVCLLTGFVILLTPILLLAGWITGGKPATALIGGVGGYALIAASAYWTGRWLARRAPNRELAASIATFLIPLIVINALGFVVMEMWGREIERFVASQQFDQSPYSTGFFLSNLLDATFLVAGAIRARYVSLRKIVR